MSATLPFAFAAPDLPARTGKQARPYQRECLSAIKAAWQGGCNRLLAVLATGTGKSWLISHVLETIERKRMLVLVHGKRLIEQMAGELAAENSALSVQVEQAHNYADHDSDIVVASIDTVGRKGSVRLDRFGGFDTVACDESHHAVSEIWLRTLRKVAEAGVLLTGWTATPFRGDGKQLSDLYDKVVYELGLRAAIEQGYLCRLRAVRVTTDVDLTGVKTRRGEFGSDFDTKELAGRINVDERNSVIVSAIEQHAEGRGSILVHAANVAHIEALTHQLRERGHQAEGIHYQTHQRDRAGIFGRFHQGETRVLVHCGVCLEGYNEPRIDTAVFAKPSKSSLYYQQALGRMTRLSPDTGKVDALAIDVVDLCCRRRILTAAQVFGMRDVDLLGEDILSAAEAVAQAEKAGVKVEDGDNMKRIRTREKRLHAKTACLRTVANDVDLFGRPVSIPKPPPQRPQRLFPWLTVGDGSQYVLGVDRGSWVIVERASGAQNWIVRLTRDGKPVMQETLTATPFADPDWQKADAFVKRHAGYWKPDGYRPRNEYDRGIPRERFLRTDAPKRQRPATSAQLVALGKWGVKLTGPVSFGEASDRLSALVYQARRRA